MDMSIIIVMPNQHLSGHSNFVEFDLVGSYPIP